MNSAFLRIITVIFSLAVMPIMANPPRLQSNSELSEAGYFHLSWQGRAGSEYLVQQATNPEFVNAFSLYRGPDTASLVSGLPDGSYYFRVRYDNQSKADAAWGDTISVKVAHHKLSRALIFFFLGAFVFFATLIVVVAGNRDKKNQNFS